LRGKSTAHWQIDVTRESTVKTRYFISSGHPYSPNTKRKGWREIKLECLNAELRPANGI